jgi:hypothetical protein
MLIEMTQNILPRVRQQGRVGGHVAGMDVKIWEKAKDLACIREVGVYLA